MFICFFGKRGSGKTQAIREISRDVDTPIFYLDFLGNFSDVGHESETAKDAVSEYIERIDSGEKKKNNLRFVVQSRLIDEDVDFLCRALWVNEGGTLVLDEVDAINYHKAKEFDHMVRFGRNKGVSIITGCRRPAEISRNITAAADLIFVFRTTEQRDIDYFEEIFGEEAQKLRYMKKYHGLFIDYLNEKKGYFFTDENRKINLYNISELNPDYEENNSELNPEQKGSTKNVELNTLNTDNGIDKGKKTKTERKNKK